MAAEDSIVELNGFAYPAAVKRILEEKGQKLMPPAATSGKAKGNSPLTLKFDSREFCAAVMSEIFVRGVYEGQSVVPRVALSPSIFIPDPPIEKVEYTYIDGKGKERKAVRCVPTHTGATPRLVYDDRDRDIRVTYTGRYLRANDVDVLMVLTRYWLDAHLELNDFLVFDIEKLLADLGYSKPEDGNYAGDAYFRVRDAIARMTEGVFAFHVRGVGYNGIRLIDQYVWNDSGRYAIKFSHNIASLFELESYLFMSVEERSKLKDFSEFTRWLHLWLHRFPNGRSIGYGLIRKSEQGTDKVDWNYKRKIVAAAEAFEKAGTKLQIALDDKKRTLTIKRVETVEAVTQVTAVEETALAHRSKTRTNKDKSVSIQSLIAQYKNSQNVIDV